MKVKELVNKVGGRTTGICQIWKGNERIATHSLGFLRTCSNRELSVVDGMNETVAFFNVTVFSNYDVCLTIQIEAEKQG